MGGGGEFCGFNGVTALASLSVAKLGENLFWDEEVLMGVVFFKRGGISERRCE